MKNIKLTPIIVSLILVLVVGLGSCTKTNSSVASPSVVAPQVVPQSETVERRVNVPMTGVHLEYFDFKQGDMIIGELVVEGQYDVDLSICYMVKTDSGTIVNVAGSDVLDLENIEGYKMFTFVAPVSGQYCFSLRGYYADKPEWKPFAQLSGVVTLRITVNPK